MKRISFFMPGRLCLFGEHTDWAGTYMSQNSEVVEGQAIVTGINLGIYADAFVNDKFKISMINDNGDKESLECDLNIKVLKDKASEPILFSYCCGVSLLSDTYLAKLVKINENIKENSAVSL